MALETELKIYKEKLPELKAHTGKFVLIVGEEVIDFFSTYEDAIKAGYQRNGLKPFLVKQVLAIEPVHHFTRQVLPRDMVYA